jgi:hypothetical protein
LALAEATAASSKDAWDLSSDATARFIDSSDSWFAAAALADDAAALAAAWAAFRCLVRSA